MQRAFLVTALLLAPACKKGAEAGDEDSAKAKPEAAGGGGDEKKTETAVAVRVATARTQSLSETIGAIGVVMARPGHIALLSAPAPGRVARVTVAVGQHVSANEPLVELEQATFHAATQSADAALSAAQSNYDREQRLAQAGIAARKDVEAAAADLAKAQSDAVAARRAEELSVLRSPINGVVTQMHAALGASVDANQPLVEVADPSALDIVLTVTPSEAGRVTQGARVTLRAGQSATGEPLGSGSVVDIAGTVDSATRGVAIRVQAPDTRRPLRIGETVFGQITVGVFARAVVVPAEAVVPEGEGFKVFVVDADGIAHAHLVQVGARADSLVQIVSGVAAGDRVVTYGAYGVEDSAKVVLGKQP